ncbi:MAG TPA: transcription elongation factor GreA [Bacillota bacterium]|jgi:transcription elongation factor GreA|nr:transcription elongation factor GreA [Bacillota bacterium]HOB87342.1 transcription elongation factor GreA [Bacillota bacterium]HOP69932.1 transcription elongation factor GreA [Bacillota bacterium]HPT34816.1 transcription elongation factor GreA [Bacillota bacterium]HPZ64517.1 transcription elongation factor GreA [Bacillota bacterium]
MSSKEIVLTRSGLEKLEKELYYLKTVKRKEVAARIRAAISYGDITDNSEYEDAKNEQAFIEGRIITLEKMLRNARIVDQDEKDVRFVSVGSTVLLKDLETDQNYTYTIVGTAEADPGANKISNESPVGRALLGLSVGEVVEVNVPAGLLRFKILEIS